MTGKTTNHAVVAYILLTWLLCGTLDALSAIVINNKIPAAVIFRYIASGFFGRQAMSGVTDMVVYGVLFHYFIALIWTALLFSLYPYFIKVFRNKILTFVYGLFIFFIMNYLVVPYLSHIVTKPMKAAGILKNMAALIIAFGFPIVWIAGKHFNE